VSELAQRPRAAVVGAGPSGFYATDQLIRAGLEVDLFDALPTPYGLVRAGVAPDHPKIKSVARVFERTAQQAAMRFFGGVELGADISRAELLQRFPVVVYAIGTELDARLGIPGEDLPGSHPATHFVCWYNGHPAHAHRQFDLSAEHALVIGNGNVALDVARVLVLPNEVLCRTDVADHALRSLAGARVRRVTVLGRRGPLQAAFSTPELIELGRLEGVNVVVDPSELELDEHSAAELAELSAHSPANRRLALLSEFAARPTTPGNRQIELRFRRSLIEIVACPDDGQVRAVRVVRNALARAADGRLVARPDGEVEDLTCGLVVRAVGYRARPITGIALDEQTGVIRNAAGRVLDFAGRVQPGEYVVGWAKRGPSGVIGSNKSDAEQTVAHILTDLNSGTLASRRTANRDTVLTWVRSRGETVVDWSGWTVIDRHEQALGEPAGRPRVKLTTVRDMCAVAGHGSSSHSLLGSE